MRAIRGLAGSTSESVGLSLGLGRRCLSVCCGGGGGGSGVLALGLRLVDDGGVEVLAELGVGRVLVLLGLDFSDGPVASHLRVLRGQAGLLGDLLCGFGPLRVRNRLSSRGFLACGDLGLLEATLGR